MKPYWSIHNHSRYSVNDALSQVPALAVEAKRRGYPVLGLTDHGAVGGLLELYRECRLLGIEPSPGMELYVTPDRETKTQGHNLHLTVNAYTEQGYRNLCALVTRTANNFHYKPRIDFADLADMADSGATQGLVVSTGCWFGVLPTIMREQGYQPALHVAKTLAGWFPRVNVELQAHGIEREQEGWTEDDMVASLVDLADEAGLPYIITSDAHYVVPEDKPLHEGLKRIASWSDDPDDAIFPGDFYSLQSAEDLEVYFEPKVLERACDNLAELAAAHCVRIPEIEEFRLLVPDVTPGADPMTELRRLVMQGLEDKGINKLPAKRREEYHQRAYEELDVVEVTGQHGILLLTALVCRWMREELIVFNTRGSANDFLLNWLLGITMVDSQKWGLRPERFMSKDRTKPPDIDLDVEHARREEVTDKLGEWFTTCQVGTIMKYSLSSLENDADESSKGSLRVRYFSTARKQGRLTGSGDDWRSIPQEDKDLLWQLSDRKLISGYGTHPAGWIVAPDPAAIANLPMVHIGPKDTGHLVTAYGKNDVEDLGFVKLDVLGLRTMTAARIAIELILADPSYDGDPMQTPEEFLEAIPLNDEKVYRRISRGRTAGMFQLEGWTQTKGLQRLQPTKIRDIIVAQALFRPAAMNSSTTSDYLGRRKGVYDVPDLHADLMAETAGTYGLLLYQEQVIGALRRIGMSVAELNKLLKAVKASNEYVGDAKKAIESALPRIEALAGARGWHKRDIAVLAEAVVGYADYGFNEAHAVAYGLLAYRTGWLAENWPLPWWAGVLTAYTNHDKEKEYVRAARANDVKIFPAHVNRSNIWYTAVPERGGIRKGLLSLPGVGPVAAGEIAANAPYKSLEDFGQRVLPRRVSGSKGLATGLKPSEAGGLVAKLDDVGALDGLE